HDGAADGVAHGGSASCDDVAQSGVQLLEVIGEGLIEKGDFVEVDDEILVVRVGRFHQSDGGRGDAGALVDHAAAVIHDDAHRNRDVFAMKFADRLEYAVFENLEC